MTYFTQRSDLKKLKRTTWSLVTIYLKPIININPIKTLKDVSYSVFYLKGQSQGIGH